ncbi:MAG: dihydrodipicolinate reductase [Candidatus Sericytochromatia bacterium]
MRIIQYGLGPIGAAITRLLATKPHAVILGAIDLDPAKVGQDLGRVTGLGHELGVLVSNQADAVLALEADVVVHCTGSYLHDVKDQLVACLTAGHNVVSTCEELAYPFRKHPALSAQLDSLARRHGVTLHGTGVNPGFVMDKLPLTLSAVCQQVRHVSVTRVVDAARRRGPLQRKVGAGMARAEFDEAVAAGRIKHHGLPESAAMLAHCLGFQVDEIAEVIEPILARSPVTTEHVAVSTGQVAGVRQVCRALTRGDEKVVLELQMYVGAKDPADTIVVSGQPDLTLTIPGGTHGDVATAAAVANALGLVVAAPAGLRTVADLPVRFASAY